MLPEVSGSAEALLREADDLMTAATLVPRGTIYDRHRAEFVGHSAALATRAAFFQTGTSGWIGGQVPAGAVAVRRWRTYAALNPIDGNGEVRQQLAVAMAYAGRCDDALRLAREISRLRANDDQFCTAFASLLSIAHETDEAFSWIDYLVKRARSPTSRG